ncbi:MAG TPA: IS110 family transposase [Cyanobacteria bacterium UBA11049]|nr:IS110 family transposase [Cyanobacteria bacterium UBA11049]
MAKHSSRRQSSKSDAVESLNVLHVNACGIDIGSASHWVSVPPERDVQAVREFGCYTPDLMAMVAWLQHCQIETVAMESTGVYWIPVFQILEKRGFEVYLVNAQYIKNVTGKKTDILDCQWIQQLHTYGLLHKSFRPDDETCALRSLVRHREMLLRYRASHVQHIQKALHQMNLKLMNVLSDVTGQTGLRILRDILAGVRDSHQLAKHRDHRCRRSEEDIAKSLEGDYRSEHLFALGQAVELYDIYTEKLQACDIEIEQHLARFQPRIDIEQYPLPPSTRPPAIKPKNDPPTDLRPALYQLAGVDLTQIDGLNILSIQTILAEVGTDMSKWRTVKHFTSWLGLCPHNQKTGGKIIRTKTKKTDNRANLAFRQAAATLGRSKSALGVFYRRMKAKLGTPKAVVATAHKLARIVYHLLKYQVPFIAQSPEQEDAQYRERALRNLQRKAHKLGAKLVIDSIQVNQEGLVS